MSPKLTRIQKETLDKMEPGKWYSAYDLKARISTLEALHRRKMLNRKMEPGYIFYPTLHIKWRKLATQEGS